MEKLHLHSCRFWTEAIWSYQKKKNPENQLKDVTDGNSDMFVRKHFVCRSTEGSELIQKHNVVDM